MGERIMNTELHWYRVELRGREVVGCVQVERSEVRGGSAFVYLQAAGSEQAKRGAYNVYCSEKLREQRERNGAAGRCRCGRARKIGTHARTGQPLKRCSVCIARGRASNKRTQGRRRGETIPAPDRLVTGSARTRDRRAEMRLEVLLEVQEAYDGDVKDFGAWLDEQIAAITGRKEKAA